MIFAQSNIKDSLHRWFHPYGMTMTRDCGLHALGSTHGLEIALDWIECFSIGFETPLQQDLHATLTRLFEGLPHRARLYPSYGRPTVRVSEASEAHRRIGYRLFEHGLFKQI